MFLTIILLSKENDNRLKEIIKKFIENSPECKLLIIDSSRPRDEINSLIKPNDNIQIYYEKNKGIYSSLNTAIKIISTPYYLVLGLDDDINFKILKLFLISLKETRVDILFAGVKKLDKKLLYLKPYKKTILNGPDKVFPSHTGGIAIRKYLHEENGYYDESLKITADLLFISNCLINNCTFKLFKGYLTKIGAAGYSKKNEYLAEYESMIVRNRLGANKLISFFRYCIRVNKRKLKNFLAFLIKKNNF